jgi:hypothetical protein
MSGMSRGANYDVSARFFGRKLGISDFLSMRDPKCGWDFGTTRSWIDNNQHPHMHILS